MSPEQVPFQIPDIQEPTENTPLVDTAQAEQSNAAQSSSLERDYVKAKAFSVPSGASPAKPQDGASEHTLSVADPPDADVGFARRPTPIHALPSFKALQMWEGIVEQTSPSEGEFVAIVEDLTNPTLGKEQVALSIDDVSRGDRPLLKPGAVFYWSIGYEENEFGTISRKSVLRFRRLPSWSERDLRRIDEEATRLAEGLGLPRPSTPDNGGASASR